MIYVLIGCFAAVTLGAVAVGVSQGQSNRMFLRHFKDAGKRRDDAFQRLLDNSGKRLKEGQGDE